MLNIALGWGLLALLGADTRPTEIPISDGTSVVLTDRAVAAKFLRTSDAFTQSTGPFERQLRLRSAREVSEAELLAFAAGQTVDWTPDEIQSLTEVLQGCRARLAPWRLPFPGTIQLIKSTGKEEGGAAYCRREAIVLSEAMLSRDGPGLEPLLLHELFHILSRHNPELRRELYAVVGFEPCGDGALPAEIEARKVTNPDAPTYDFAITLEVDGQAAKYVPVITTTSADPTAGFKFPQLEFRLMAITSEGDRWQPALSDDKLRLLPIAHPAYQQRIGKNTGYTIHAEEVLADNFKLLMQGERDVPSPEILQNVENVLRKYAGKVAEISTPIAAE